MVIEEKSDILLNPINKLTDETFLCALVSRLITHWKLEKQVNIFHILA